MKGFLVLFIFIILISFTGDTNKVDPDQTPRSAASDLGLQCFPVCYLWEAMHIWVKYVN